MPTVGAMVEAKDLNKSTAPTTAKATTNNKPRFVLEKRINAEDFFRFCRFKIIVFLFFLDPLFMLLIIHPIILENHLFARLGLTRLWHLLVCSYNHLLWLSCL